MKFVISHAHDVDEVMSDCLVMNVLSSAIEQAVAIVELTSKDGHNHCFGSF